MHILVAITIAQAAVGAIKGVVIDTTGHAVRGVTVQVVGSNISAVTDTAGEFRLNRVPVGRQIVALGHVARQVDVKADTAVGIALMAREVPRPRAIWLGCNRADRRARQATAGAEGAFHSGNPFGTCDQMRYVATFRQHDIPLGIGVIRDSTTWKAFLSRHATGQNSNIGDDVIDWTHEMLVIVSYGAGTLPLDPGDGINRVERHADRLTVLLGPDSSSGALNTTGWIPATVIAVKRTTLPVEYRAILPTTHVPPTVDWSGQ